MKAAVRSLSRTCRALGRDERGNGLIELGMLAPALAVLAVGIVDLSQGFSRRMELHDAVHRTLEKVAARRFRLTLDSQGEVVTTAIAAEASTAAGVLPAAVDVDAWLECDGEQQPSFSANCPPLQNPPAGCSNTPRPPELKCEPILARYIRVRVDTTYRPTFGKVVSTKADGTVDLFAEAAVRVQ